MLATITKCNPDFSSDLLAFHSVQHLEVVCSEPVGLFHFVPNGHLKMDDREGILQLEISIPLVSKGEGCLTNVYLRFKPCPVEICSWSPKEWLASTGHSAQKYGNWITLQRPSCRQCVELSGDTRKLKADKF